MTKGGLPWRNEPAGLPRIEVANGGLQGPVLASCDRAGRGADMGILQLAVASQSHTAWSSAPITPGRSESPKNGLLS